MNQLIAIDPTALDSLLVEIARLHKRLDAVDMIPRDEWVTVKAFAAKIGRHPRTVQRRIDRGEVDTQLIGGETMVRFNPAV